MRSTIALISLVVSFPVQAAWAGDISFKVTGFNCEKWFEGFSACDVNIAVTATGYPGSFRSEVICNAEVETTPPVMRSSTQSGTAVAYLRGNHSATANVTVVIAWGRNFEVRRAELKGVNCYLP
jgi:hypothetical protein